LHLFHHLGLDLGGGSRGETLSAATLTRLVGIGTLQIRIPFSSYPVWVPSVPSARRRNTARS
jgi:hypothetical protein